MIKLNDITAKKLLIYLNNAEKQTSTRSRAFANLVKAKTLLSPIITKHSHQKKITNAMQHIIDKNFDGKISEFTMWYINEFHKHDYSHIRLNYTNVAINEIICVAQTVLARLQSIDAQEDEFLQRKLATKYSILVNLLHKTRNYDNKTLVIYDVQINKPFLHKLNSHNVIEINQHLAKHGSLYQDMKNLHSMEH